LKLKQNDTDLNNQTIFANRLIKKNRKGYKKKHKSQVTNNKNYKINDKLSKHKGKININHLN